VAAKKTGASHKKALYKLSRFFEPWSRNHARELPRYLYLNEKWTFLFIVINGEK